MEKKLKKSVIDRPRVHTFPWLNLLLEPKRHLQRFGFVYLEHVFPPKNTPLGVEGRWLGGSTVLPLGVAPRYPGGRVRLPSEGKKTTPSLPPKKIVKKFVIGRHAVHTFSWLNLLLEPKRHLQRFGFVYLKHAFPPGFSTLKKIFTTPIDKRTENMIQYTRS